MKAVGGFAVLDGDARGRRNRCPAEAPGRGRQVGICRPCPVPPLGKRREKSRRTPDCEGQLFNCHLRGPGPSFTLRGDDSPPHPVFGRRPASPSWAPQPPSHPRPLGHRSHPATLAPWASPPGPLGQRGRPPPLPPSPWATGPPSPTSPVPLGDGATLPHFPRPLGQRGHPPPLPPSPWATGPPQGGGTGGQGGGPSAPGPPGCRPYVSACAGQAPPQGPRAQPVPDASTPPGSGRRGPGPFPKLSTSFEQGRPHPFP